MLRNTAQPRVTFCVCEPWGHPFKPGSERGRWKTGTAVVSPGGPGRGTGRAGVLQATDWPRHARQWLPSPGHRQPLSRAFSWPPRVSPRAGSPAPQCFMEPLPRHRRDTLRPVPPSLGSRRGCAPGRVTAGPAGGSAQSACHLLSLMASAWPRPQAASLPGTHREGVSSGEKGGGCGWTLSLGLRQGRGTPGGSPGGWVEGSPGGRTWTRAPATWAPPLRGGPHLGDLSGLPPLSAPETPTVKASSPGADRAPQNKEGPPQSCF